MSKVGRTIRTVPLAPLALGAAAGGTPLTAQTVHGVPPERGSDRPIDPALVSLVTVEGASVESVLSDGDGCGVVVLWARTR